MLIESFILLMRVLPISRSAVHGYQVVGRNLWILFAMKKGCHCAVCYPIAPPEFLVELVLCFCYFFLPYEQESWQCQPWLSQKFSQ